MTPRKKKPDPPPETVDDPGVVDALEQAAELPDESEMAELPDESDVASSLSRMVAFHLGEQRYGFPIESVQEIQQIVALAEIPDDTQAVLGLINLRGSVIPAVDLRLLLGMESREHTLETPMVICRFSDGLIAFVVDGVDDVAELPADCMQAPPKMHSLAGRMLGVCRLEDGMVFLLDVEKLLEPVDLELSGEEEPA